MLVAEFLCFTAEPQSVGYKRRVSKAWGPPTGVLSLEKRPGSSLYSGLQHWLPFHTQHSLGCGPLSPHSQGFWALLWAPRGPRGSCVSSSVPCLSHPALCSAQGTSPALPSPKSGPCFPSVPRPGSSSQHPRKKRLVSRPEKHTFFFLFHSPKSQAHKKEYKLHPAALISLVKNCYIQLYCPKKEFKCFHLLKTIWVEQRNSVCV